MDAFLRFNTICVRSFLYYSQSLCWKPILWDNHFLIVDQITRDLMWQSIVTLVNSNYIYESHYIVCFESVQKEILRIELIYIFRWLTILNKYTFKKIVKKTFQQMSALPNRFQYCSGNVMTLNYSMLSLRQRKTISVN